MEEPKLTALKLMDKFSRGIPIHDIDSFVQQKLEEDIKRDKIGIFDVAYAAGKFFVDRRHRQGNAFQLPDRLERYDLTADVRQFEVPGFRARTLSLDRVHVGYEQGFGPAKDNVMEISLEHSPVRTEDHKQGIFRFNLSTNRVDYVKDKYGLVVTPEILDWIYSKMRQ